MVSKSLIDNIKCDFFIPKIFDIIKKYRAFRIVNYNKKLQKKLNISLKDFKEIYDLSGPTCIEIIPVKNKYGKYINIKENEKSFYHIFFNNIKKEIKNKYSINEKDKVAKIKIIIINNDLKCLEKLFNQCDCIE